MKILITIFAVMGLATAALAADTTDFKWNGEIKTRYTADQGYKFFKGRNTTNAAVGDVEAYSAGRNYNKIEQRNILGVKMNKGENFAGQLTLVNAFTWGDPAIRGTSANYSYGNPQAVVATSGNSQNAVLVNEAYAWYKANDMLALKYGRSNFTIAGEAVIGKGTAMVSPTTFDGFWSIWDFEPLTVNLFGLKLVDNNISGTTGANSSAIDDAETVMYGAVLGAKNLPSWLKKAELHVFQLNDETTVIDRSEMLRYGLYLTGAHMNFDYRLIFDNYGGKVKNTATEKNLKGMMYDLMVGYTFPEFMMFRVAGNYHSDSGGEQLANDNPTYRPFAYTSTSFGGDMSLVSWGNLTYYGLDLGLKPMDDLNVKLAYWLYKRTNEKDQVKVNGTAVGAITAGSSNNIGTELDLVVTKKFGSNFNVEGLYGMFTPDTLIKGDPAPATNGPTDTHSRVRLTANLTF